MEELLEEIKDVKLHSMRGILIGTFLGGPLAAGYLVMENYQNLGNRDSASKSLIYGILGTIILFGITLALPEEIMDRIPSAAISFVSVAVIYGIVQQQFGEIFLEHDAKDRTFYSRWRAVAVGLISLVLLGIIGFSLVFVFFSFE